MPQDQLTPAEITEVGAAIATAVGEALAPAFDKIAAALAPPKPTAAVPAAPAKPRTLAEVEAENQFLRQIVEDLRARLDQAQDGPR